MTRLCVLGLLVVMMVAEAAEMRQAVMRGAVMRQPLDERLQHEMPGETEPGGSLG